MQIANMSGETRKAAGKHANERLRRKGLVPAVIYGHGETPETVAVDRHGLEQALHHLRHVVNLDVGGRAQNYLIKDVQYDHLQKTPIHVDLMRVDENERVRVKVALELKGTPEGVREGGVLLQSLTDLEIECKLLEIPETIRVNVADLHLNQAVHVREVELPPGVRALQDPNQIVAAVRHKREEVVAAAPAAEGAAVEPEVIGRVAKEEPEGEEKPKEKGKEKE